MLKNVGYLIAIWGLVLLGLTGCGSEDILIGALVSATSADGAPAEGADLLRGMELAVKEINEAGGINGSQLVINHADVQTDVEKTREAFLDMEENNPPLFYVSTLSTVSLAAADLAESAHAPLIASITSTTGITEGRSQLFRYWPSVEDQLKPMLRMIDLINPKSIAVFYPDETYGQSFYAAYEPELSSSGVSVEPVRFPPSTTDFRRHTRDLSGYDTILITGYKEQIVTAIEDIRASGYGGNIVTTSTASFPDIRSAPSMDGVYMLAPSLYNTDDIAARRFVERFESYYGRPANHMAGGGYDAVMLVAQLLEDQEVSRDSLRSQMEKGFVYPGVNGSVNVRPGEHDFAFPYLPARSDAGRLLYL